MSKKRKPPPSSQPAQLVQAPVKPGGSHKQFSFKSFLWKKLLFIAGTIILAGTWTSDKFQLDHWRGQIADMESLDIEYRFNEIHTGLNANAIINLTALRPPATDMQYDTMFWRTVYNH